MADKPISMSDALKKYDRQADHEAVTLAEQERREVVQRFALDAWPTMPLERYALGQGDKQSSYCWWLEFGTPHVGSMKGGSARKHIIYKQQDGNWYYDRQQFKNEQEAWQALRTSFLEAFAEAQAGDWEKVDHTDGIALGPALSAKSLYCYFPNELLPIASTAHLHHFLDRLNEGDKELSGHGVVRLNGLLLDSLRQRPEFKGWTTKELERFLYYWADPRDQRQVVKVAPGRNADRWQECLDGGYICVGWKEIGDVREFESKDSYQATFNEAFGPTYNHHKPQLTKKGKELWTLRELEPGDLIVANHGIDRILAVGTVVEPGYEYVANRLDYRHLVRVKWDTSYAQDIPPQERWRFSTVEVIPQTLAARILAKQPAVDGRS